MGRAGAVHPRGVDVLVGFCGRVEEFGVPTGGGTGGKRQGLTLTQRGKPAGSSNRGGVVDELFELALQAVEFHVDVPLVVAAPTGFEDDVPNIVWGYRVVDVLAGQSGLHTLEEIVDLVDFVSPAQGPALEPFSPIHALLPLTATR